MLGITAKYPEFRGVGVAMVDGTYIENGVMYNASFITPANDEDTPLLYPERTALNLAEATNEQLLALGSLYHLPTE